MFLFNVILLFMIVGAIIAAEVKNMLSAIIAVGAAGVGVSILFLYLKAPDIAITQVVVEVLALVVLIRVANTADNKEIEKQIGSFANVIGLVFIGLFIAFCLWAFTDAVPFAQPLMRVSKHYLDAGLAETGAANMVAAVILDYRAYDTLGEAVVIFTSILGAFTILRTKGKKAVA